MERYIALQAVNGHFEPIDRYNIFSPEINNERGRTKWLFNTDAEGLEVLKKLMNGEATLTVSNQEEERARRDREKWEHEDYEENDHGHDMIQRYW